MKIYSYSQNFFNQNNNIYDNDFEEIKNKLNNNESVEIVTLTIGTFIDNFKLKTNLDIEVSKNEQTKHNFIIKLKENESISRDATAKETKPNKKASQKRKRITKKATK